MKKKVLFVIAIFFVSILSVNAAYYYEKDNGNYALCTQSVSDCVELSKNTDGLIVNSGKKEIEYKNIVYYFSLEAQEKYYKTTYGVTRMYFYMSNDKFVLCSKKGSCSTYTREQLEKKDAIIANKSEITIGDDSYYYNSTYESNNPNSTNSSNNVPSDTTTGTKEEAKDDLGYCTKLKEPLQFLGNIVLIVKIVIPIIIIIYGSVDFFRAVVGSKDDEIKKSAHSLLFRIIAGVAIFLIPTLVSLVFSLISDFANVKGTFNACQKCVLNVRKCK